MARKKRNRGKRRKNRKNGRYFEPKGTGKRNRNSRICTHYDAQNEIQCKNRVYITRGERPLCEEHLSRHGKGCKTRAIIIHCQGKRFSNAMGDAP